MFRRLLLLAALLASFPAFGQSVQYVAPVTRGHVAVWNTNGVLADGGSSASSPITSFGVVNNGGAGICVNSALPTAGPYNALCFGASTSGPATISLQNYGGASAQSLQFVVNGTPVTIPTGGGSFIMGIGSFTVGDVPCFSSVAGIVQDCGLGLSAGTVVAGIWHGTPVAVAYGGTGATTPTAAQIALGLGTMATQNANALDVTGVTLLTGLPNPVNPTDAVNLQYVNAFASGIIIQPQVALATAAVLPNSPTYSNGTAGVGATLTAGSNSTLTVDSTVATLNTVVLVKNQASAFQNGVYTVTTAGSGSAAWVLTRATYFDTPAQMLAGSYFFVTGGSANPNSSWVLQSTVTTVGTTAATFNQFSAGGAVTSVGGATGVITLSNGLQVSGNAISTVAGVNTGAANAITSTPSISSSNCGVPVWAGGNAFYTITVGAASGFTTNCLIEIYNSDVYTGPATGRGKSIAVNGLTSFILYPQQVASFRNIGSAWSCESGCAQLWNAGNQIVTFYVDTGGSNTAGASDGLAAGLPAFATRQYCANVAYTVFNNGSNVKCLVTSGQTIQELVSVFYQMPSGGVLIFTSGGTATWKPANSSYALEFGDGALVQVNNTTFDTTSVTSPAGYVLGHNYSVLDVNANVTINTGAITGSAFSCDYQAHFNINNGLTVANVTGAISGFLYEGCQSSTWNINGSHVLSGNPSIGRYAWAMTGTTMTFQGNVSFTGSGTVSASLITGNSVLSNFSGAALPGGTPGQATGGQYCTSQC